MKSFRVDLSVHITLPEVGTPEYDAAMELVMDSGNLTPEESEGDPSLLDLVMARVLACHAIESAPEVTSARATGARYLYRH